MNGNDFTLIYGEGGEKYYRKKVRQVKNSNLRLNYTIT